jgi:tripartite-type tricarboxylate transporter receptor subunit TctC
MAPAAWAQSYPDRTVRVIVPYAPGGPTDVIARLIALKLSELAGKQFYIENIPGGGGNIGMGRAAQATPDGYTKPAKSPLCLACAAGGSSAVTRETRSKETRAPRDMVLPMIYLRVI